jgi:hypothetical protein
MAKFQCPWGEAVDMLVVKAGGMTSRHPSQAGHGLFGNFHETRRRSDTTAFIEMANDVLRGGLGELGVE